MWLACGSFGDRNNFCVFETYHEGINMREDKNKEPVTSFFTRLIEGLRNKNKEDLERQFPDPEKLKKEKK